MWSLCLNFRSNWDYKPCHHARLPYPLQQFPTVPPPVMVSRILLSISAGFNTMGTSWEWNHSVCAFISTSFYLAPNSQVLSELQYRGGKEISAPSEPIWLTPARLRNRVNTRLRKEGSVQAFLDLQIGIFTRESSLKIWPKQNMSALFRRGASICEGMTGQIEILQMALRNM